MSTRSAGSYRHQMVRGTLAGFGGLAAQRVAGIVSVAMLTRWLGLSLFGVVSILLVLVNSNGLLDLGAGTAAVREMARTSAVDDRRASIAVLRATLTVYATISVIFAAIVLPAHSTIASALDLAPRDLPAGRALLLWAPLLYAVSNAAIALAACLQGLQRLPVVNAGLAAGNAVYLCVVALGFGFGASVNFVALALLSLYMIQVAWYSVALARELPRGTSKMPAPRLGALLSYGLRVQAIAVSDFLLLQAPLVAAGLLFGAETAGVLDLSIRLPLLLAGLSTPILPPLVAAASRLASSQDVVRLRSLLSRALRYQAMIVLPAIVAVIAAGPLLLRAWTGDPGVESETLRVVAPGVGLHVLMGSITAVSLGAGWAGLVLRFKVIGLVAAAAVATAFHGDVTDLALAFTTGLAISSVFLMQSVGPKLDANGLLIGATAIRPVVEALGVAVLCGTAVDLAVGPLIGTPTAAALVVGGPVFGLMLLRRRAFTRADAAELLGRTDGQLPRLVTLAFGVAGR